MRNHTLPAPLVPELVRPLTPELAEPLVPEVARPTGPLAFVGRLVGGVFSVVNWLFGAAVLTVGLAILSGIPVAQFLALGYLLEAGGRVARTGRLRDGFIGVGLAARLGVIVVACCVLMVPVWIVSALARTAAIIEPGGPAERAFRLGLLVLAGLTFLHAAAACARGGRLWHFLWPLNIIWLIRRVLRGGYYTEARDAVWDTVQALRVPYYFWMGLRGFVAGMAWLAVPVTLMASAHAQGPAATLLGWLGAVLLGGVLLFLPFVQLRMAEENRFLAAFDLRAAWAGFLRAPLLFALALLVTLLTALPLYLLRIETLPKETTWLPGLVFISFIFPSRLMAGWALARAKRREEPRHWLFTAVAWVPMLPVALLYVGIVYITQFTNWNGVWSLYEQHAFLLPVPLLGG